MNILSQLPDDGRIFVSAVIENSVEGVEGVEVAGVEDDDIDNFETTLVPTSVNIT